MAPSGKSAAAAAKDRRKSSNTTTASSVTAASSPKPTHVVTLKVTPTKLRAIVDPDFVKEDTPAKESPAAAPNSNMDNASDSTPNSPPAGTPAAQSVSMGPPTEGPKKKGVKRSAGAAANGNGEPKVRGKPGPKKKQKLDDGAADGRGALAAHKLGPKANQGAINAGLRALDRSGKPCRKWARGGFTLKSFTGVVWEIPRWTAPPKPRPETASADESTPTPASDGSNKENKEGNSQVVKSEASNNGGDVEMRDTPSFVADNSPAPVAVAVA
ncbi:INO80 complex, subunit Ies4 [Staphylotrichum tortipilum]|uniref:INO80 complex, subunit Ies4 n=1 Tax=Staphylotrichum tortipilum TaxID=2831512 RepID=A0AAN6MHZ8_9PEZI|nr:INO80 complex, subunit Ies4 [Staphylotrichum longicolle]